LKNKTGRDAEVQRFIDSYPQSKDFTQRLREFLLYLLPQYLREGKAYLTIGIGCTGGRHRSVALAERIATALSSEGYKTKIVHRDIGRAGG